MISEHAKSGMLTYVHAGVCMLQLQHALMCSHAQFRDLSEAVPAQLCSADMHAGMRLQVQQCGGHKAVAEMTGRVWQIDSQGDGTFMRVCF